MERKMKRLTIAETQRQLINIRRAEEIKRQIVREGLKYKKLLEQQKMKKAEEKAKMIEDLKDKALDLMLEKENIKRVRKAEAKEMAIDVAYMNKEIAQNAELTKKSIKSRRERNAAVRRAKIIAERNRLRYQKIKALKYILAKKLAAEQALFKKRYDEAKKIQELDHKARGLVKRLSVIASSFDKKSIDVLKKIKAEKKAILIRKLLQEKAEEINAKRVLINNYKLRIHKLEEEELKHNMQLSGVASDVLIQKTLARIARMRAIRENRRRKRITLLHRKLNRAFLDRRNMLWKERCLRFRKVGNMKLQEAEARKRKIALLICPKSEFKELPKPQHQKCYDFIHNRFHRLVRQNHKYGCPFARKFGMRSCDKIELP
jgi:hypothetical protein